MTAVLGGPRRRRQPRWSWARRPIRCRCPPAQPHLRAPLGRRLALRPLDRLGGHDELRRADRQCAPMNELFPLDRAAEAYDRMMSGKARFRVVLTTGT